MSGEHIEGGGYAQEGPAAGNSGEQIVQDPQALPAELDLMERVLAGLRRSLDNEPATPREATQADREDITNTFTTSATKINVPPVTGGMVVARTNTDNFSWFKPPVVVALDAGERMINRVATTRAMRQEHRVNAAHKEVKLPSRGLAIDMSPVQLALPSQPTPELPYDPLESPWHQVVKNTTVALTEYEIMLARRQAYRVNGALNRHKIPASDGPVVSPFQPLDETYSELTRRSGEVPALLYEQIRSERQQGRHRKASPPTSAIVAAEAIQTPEAAEAEAAMAPEAEPALQPTPQVPRKAAAEIAPLRLAGPLPPEVPTPQRPQETDQPVHVITAVGDAPSEAPPQPVFMSRVQPPPQPAELPQNAIVAEETSGVDARDENDAEPEMEIWRDGKLVPLVVEQHIAPPEAETEVTTAVAAIAPARILPEDGVALYRSPAVTTYEEGNLSSPFISPMPVPYTHLPPLEGRASVATQIAPAPPLIPKVSTLKERTATPVGRPELTTVEPPIIPKMRTRRFFAPDGPTTTGYGTITVPPPFSSELSVRSGQQAEVYPQQASEIVGNNAELPQKDGRREALLGRLALRITALIKRRQETEIKAALDAKVAQVAAQIALEQLVANDAPAQEATPQPAPQAVEAHTDELRQLWSEATTPQETRANRVKKVAKSALIGAGFVAASFVAGRIGRRKR